MAFIKAQKIVRDANGKILSGSASIVDVEYIPDKDNHSKQVMREKLGKVLYLSEDKKSGVFLSPTRGLVEYNSVTDMFSPVDKGDERIDNETLFKEPQVHTVFGDSYLTLSHMKRMGMTSLLRDVFIVDEEYERVITHIVHGILRDGGHTPCDLFVNKSFVSYLCQDIPVKTLASDTQYFQMMGDDDVKVRFFRGLVKEMRKTNKRFGKACYLDSTPLPNDINSPFSKLCSHGLTATSVQMRLALLLDVETGVPVWYEVIPGNLLDLSTLGPILSNVEATLGITVVSLVLDAGYVSGDLLKLYNADTYDPENEDCRRMIARMPKKKGYPYDKLYESNHKLFPNAKYTFVRDDHRYFGIRREVEISGYKENAYVYVDFDNALWKFKEYLEDHQDEYEKLSDKEKTRMTYRFGMFVLISNVEMTPKEALDWYFGRMDIEKFFKTSKEYLGLLPLSKWSDQTVRGKILSDIIGTIVYNDMVSSRTAGLSMPRIIGSTQSLMCTRNGDRVIVESPNKNTKDAFGALGISIPSSLSLESFKDTILGL